MTDTKFTPGLLTIESYPSTGVMLRDERGERVGYVYDADKVNLLAAAPELYAALEAVEWRNVNAMPGVYCPNCIGEKPHHKPGCQLDAALRKARGEMTADEILKREG